MRMALMTLSLFVGLAAAAQAQAPTIACQDGTTVPSPGPRNACRGHGGIQTATTPPTGQTPPDPRPQPGPATTPTPGTARTLRPQAPGGGPGLVWVNSSSHVYHCPTDRYYGRTRRGSYMNEAAAKAAGAHIEHGETCS